MLTKSREPGRAGFSHGGVAIMARASAARMEVYPFPNAEKYEVLPAKLSLVGLTRKVFVIACYLPPGYSAARGQGCLQHISDIVLEIKASFDDPYICITGDFNQWQIDEALLDYPDLIEVLSAPTRNDRLIDRSFINWHEDVNNVAVLAPLETDEQGGRVRRSDHKVQLIEAEVLSVPPCTWTTVTYRPFTDQAAAAFKHDLELEDWSGVIAAKGSNSKATSFQMVLDRLIDKHFPTKTFKRKSTDLPWMNDTARKKIRRKRGCFRAEGRSERWWALREDLEEYLERRRLVFLDKERKKMTGPDASRQFYKNVKAYQTAERPKAFDVRNILPDKSDGQVASEVATYFNRISSEFSPLSPWEIPVTYDRPTNWLTADDVEKRLRQCKKPNSRVEGDLFPKLVAPCASLLALPLANIYNEILATRVWPVNWKKEFVTVIPKKTVPVSLSDLRNISCTKFVSKIFEGFVLQIALEELSLKKNQFGGVKGCSTSHMLIEMWQMICENAEDYRYATVLGAIDYAKAFNRLSYQHCLDALKKKGASNNLIRLVATFLTNRTMTVRVGNTWSEPLDVNGGAPQGSVLGVFLFNLTTDDLEDKFLDSEKLRLGLPPTERPEVPDFQQPPPDIDRSTEYTGHHTTSSPNVNTNSPPPSPPVSPIQRNIYRHGDLLLNFQPNTINAPTSTPSPPPRPHPPEAPVGTQVLQERPVVVVKYVDDNVLVEKLNFGRTAVVFIGGKYIKSRLAIGIQNAFDSITRHARRKKMKVNADKTQLLCISDSLNHTTQAFIEEANLKIVSGEHMKVLGFCFSNRPTVAAHVLAVAKKLRKKFWVLRHLKKVGFTEKELLEVYNSVILPAADYCDVVYHSMMTSEQEDMLEKAQVGALRCIFGYELSARKLREKAQISTLRERRVAHCDKFAAKCLLNPRFSGWFPKKQAARPTRSGETYQEFYARCDRLKNSPLFYMRRRLNGKNGKYYSERFAPVQT